MNSTRQRIAEELLGASLIDGLFAMCPGAAKHTGKTSRKDFRVVLDGAPTGYCFHTHCGADVDAFNLELRRRIWYAENGRDATAPRGHWAGGVAAEPKREAASRPELNRATVDEFVRGVPKIGMRFLRERSAVDPAGVSSGDFLDALFAADERVLVFTSQRSQGDFLWVAGNGPLGGGWRLSQQRRTHAVRSELPNGAPEGVWYLVQPVSGKWDIVREHHQYSDGTQEAKWSRRSQASVTGWRHFVLESDELPTEEWLRVLVNLPLPISAIYTSGKRSVHALVTWDVPSKGEWDVVTKVLRQIVCPLGADPAALTAVRLSRLPGCKRGERMQELLYLNPAPTETAIRFLPSVRAGEAREVVNG